MLTSTTSRELTCTASWTAARQKIITPDWDSHVVQAINDDPARTSGAYVISVPGRT
ncbi:MAG TPA: hypothetical protein VF086_00785 [Propionibacteriaceae bacterium]